MHLRRVIAANRPLPKNRNFMKQTPYYVTDEFSRRDEYPAATICRSGVDGGVGNCCCRFLSNCSVSLVVRCDCIRAANNPALLLAKPRVDISAGWVRVFFAAQSSDRRYSRPATGGSSQRSAARSER